MKRILRFSKYFIPAAILSSTIAVLSIAGFLTKGFNLGVDFQAGLLQEIQFAPTAFSLTYSGPGNAVITLSRTALDIVISGAGVEEVTYRFAFTSYPSQQELARALREIDGIGVSETAPGNTSTAAFIQSAQSSPTLDASIPFVVHYLPPNASPVRIEDVRASLLPLGTAAVQNLGTPGERRFMIRMEDKEFESSSVGVPAERIIAALESNFGRGEVAVTRSDYVGSRFSKQLTDQAGLLTVLTLLLILAYSSIRFKPQYAIGAVIAILNDALVVVAFVVWTRMEFNTTTIAAILTILGYSINNTIVVFDRVRENRRIFPDDAFVDVLNRSLTGTLSRSIITTLTTMLAVISLFLFTTGSMKDFAPAILVGMTSGVYTTIFIASGFVYFWDIQANKREKKKLKAAPAKA
jgi:preprotein translocase subunit SecF